VLWQGGNQWKGKEDIYEVSNGNAHGAKLMSRTLCLTVSERTSVTEMDMIVNIHLYLLCTALARHPTFGMFASSRRALLERVGTQCETT